GIPKLRTESGNGAGDDLITDTEYFRRCGAGDREAHRPIAGRARSSGERGPTSPARDHRIRANGSGGVQVYEGHHREPGTVGRQEWSGLPCKRRSTANSKRTI